MLDMPAVTLLDMRDAAPPQLDEAARILVDALAHAPSAWKNMQAARDEVGLFVREDDRNAILAIREETVIGWIGAIHQNEFAWEMHPLVIDPPYQRQGIGAALVRALEERARAAGVVTIWLGTDDDFGGTSIFDRDLYPDVLGAMQDLKVTTHHPFAFYKRLGYSVTGVLPDVDGIGRHDILMAKRLQPSAGQ